MAVFFVNKCTYPDCRKKFSTLSDLIYHIEDEHIDFSPAIIEEKERQKNQCIPLSYVLKYSQFCYRAPEIKDNAIKIVGPLKVESDYILSEHDSVLIESEISDDSWIDEFCTDFSNGYGRTKKFVCPVPGCNKRYKNINGVKYHRKNSHEIKKSSVKLRKMHKCHCGKSYKTAQGLKTHSTSHKELSLSTHKTSPTNSQLLLTQKNNHTLHQHDVLNHNLINKSDVVDEDILTYSYLEHAPKINEMSDHNNNGHFGFFTAPYSYNNFIGNETFSDNLMLEEAIHQYYQFSSNYKKY